MPRKDFIKNFAENLTKVKWVDALQKRKETQKRFTEAVKQDVVIAQKDIIEIETQLAYLLKRLKKLKCLWAKQR